MKTIINLLVLPLLALPAGGHVFRDFLQNRYNIEQVRIRLINVWREAVYRLSLIAGESTLEGKCSYTVTCK